MTKMSMTVIIAAFLAATPSFAAPAEDDAYSWHDGTTLNIEGRGFPGMTASPYIRLPDKWKGVVPDDYGLAHMGPVYADAVRHVLGTSAGK